MDFIAEIELFLSDPEVFTTEVPVLTYDTKKHRWKRTCIHAGCGEYQYEGTDGYPLYSHTCYAIDGKRYVRWMDRPKRSGAFE